VAIKGACNINRYAKNIKKKGKKKRKLIYSFDPKRVYKARQSHKNLERKLSKDAKDKSDKCTLYRVYNKKAKAEKANYIQEL